MDPGMNRLRGLLLGIALFTAACGGDESVASKSAAAYDEAKAKGIEVGGGHEHAGHDRTGGSTATDHSAHGGAAAADHAAMGHGMAADAHAGHAGHGSAGGAAMDHSAHRSGGSAVDHAAMGHGTAASSAHAEHGTPAHTGAHDQHAGMPHSATAAGADPHAQHRTATMTPAPVAATAPRSNAEIRNIQPSATLQPDAFDAPAPVSVDEARKASHGGGHEGHAARGITPGTDRENPPTPMPAIRDGSKRNDP